jgi:L-serine dehydratase
MISVFDMFKVGIGPSSSHTVGPMRAAAAFCEVLKQAEVFNQITAIKTELYGSLGQTGKGHGTGKAVILGLLGYLPENVPVKEVDSMLTQVETAQALKLNQEHMIIFPKDGAIVFHRRKTLSLHSNGMTFFAFAGTECVIQKTYYSIGGGFIIEESEFEAQKAEKFAEQQVNAPFPFSTATELMQICHDNGFSISTLMIRNEMSIMSEEVLRNRLVYIWGVMKECVQNGINTEGILPGGLKVHRRAYGLYLKLKN